MKRLSFRYFFSMLAILACMVTVAAPEKGGISFNHFGIKVRDGLSDNCAYRVFKDSKGFMWFATRGGLDRYDGYDFVHYNGFGESGRTISSNFVRDIQEDNFDRLWIATESGLNCLNMRTGKVETKWQPPFENILSMSVNKLCFDKAGNLWVGHSKGLACIGFDEKGEMSNIKTHITLQKGVTSICQNGNDLWLTGDGILRRLIQMPIGHFREVPINKTLKEAGEDGINCLLSFGDYIWIGTNDGLFFFNTANETMGNYRHNPGDPTSLPDNIVSSLEVNNSGEIITGTVEGLSLMNKKGFIRISKGYGRFFKNNPIHDILVDQSNNIWVATEQEGINRLSPRRLFYEHFLQAEKTQKYTVQTISGDDKGTILAGLNSGGLALLNSDNLSGKPFRIISFGDDRGNVQRIVKDSKGDFWLGVLGGGLGKIDKNTLKNPVIEWFDFENSRLTTDMVTDIALDKGRNGIWVSSADKLNFLEISKGKVQSVNIDNQQKPENIQCILLDKNSRLWLGGDGLSIVELKKSQDIIAVNKVNLYPYKLDEPDSHQLEKISCILETRKGTIWLGSQGNGIYRMDVDSTNKIMFTNFSNFCGLTDNMICNLLEDASGNIWISTINGMYFFNTEISRAFKFDEGDGLPTSQFISKSGFVQPDGQLWFGTNNGLIGFFPKINTPPLKDRKVVFANLRIGNSAGIPFQDNKHLSASIEFLPTVHLYPSDASFEVSFSALDYLEDKKIFYAYRLIGFENLRNVGLVNRHARYTNLEPGKYVLEVLCTNSDNTWSKLVTNLNIIVHPPFYKTWWFRLFILAVVVLLLVFGYRYRNKSQKRIQKELEKKISERTRDLSKTMDQLVETQKSVSEQNRQLQRKNVEIISQKDMLLDYSHKMEVINTERLAFFTNITHEFKTPLTLILGPLNRLIDENDKPHQVESLKMIQRNARTLLTLINKLVNLRNTHTGHRESEHELVDFPEFIKIVLHDFSTVFRENDINFKAQLRFPFDDSFMKISRQDLQKILFNLLSNAVKYTPPNGTVNFMATMVRSVSKPGILYPFIAVSNTGNQIPEEEKELIFERLYKSEIKTEKIGIEEVSSGIGLYLVRQIVHSLGGKIKVRNDKQTGVHFSLMFPAESVTDTRSASLIVNDWINPEKETYPDIPFEQTDNQKPVLLLAEDNEDMRNYLKELLSPHYQVAEAVNGEKGLEMAVRIIPDFIVSDLMMPEVDGIDFCKAIRRDNMLCHIPFLMLTALDEDTSRLESYQHFVDGYLTKPFDENMLFARIKAIINIRESAQKKFLNNMYSPVGTMAENMPNKQFMDKLLVVMKSKYSDPDFGAAELASLMNVSNTLLYKKITSLTGLSAARFISHYRMDLAKELIDRHAATENLNIAGIAYSVGFNDPKYFSKCFFTQFGILPKDLVAKLEKGQRNE